MLRYFLFFSCYLFLISGLAAQLLITQYYEGASNDKYLEVTNLGNTSCNLSEQGIYAYLFANVRADDPANHTASLGQRLTGAVAPLGSVLFKNGLAVGPAYAASLGTGVNFCTFSGDDLIVLSTATDGLTTVGSAWAQRIDVVGDGANWGQDVSFVRDPGVFGPNLHFTPSEWISVSLAVVNAAADTETAYLGHHATLLPVVLTSFVARAKEEEVEVQFTTAREDQNDHFVLERSIPDGSSFEPLAIIPGKGTSEEPQSYVFQDQEPHLGWNTYRLQQVDWDGVTQFFGPVTAYYMNQSGAVSVGPIPTSEVLWINVKERTQNLVFHLLDQQGKPLRKQTLNAGENSLTISLAGLAGGSYFLVWEVDGLWQRRTVIKAL